MPRRPGPPGADSGDQIPEQIKAERLARLQDLLWTQQDAFNESMVGRTLPVLFERPARHPGQLAGRSPFLQAVHAQAPERVLGQVADVRIVAASRNSLTGELVQKHSEAA